MQIITQLNYAYTAFLRIPKRTKTNTGIVEASITGLDNDRGNYILAQVIMHDIVHNKMIIATCITLLSHSIGFRSRVDQY